MTEYPILPFLEKMLDWTAKRQQAISSNLANIDTPGYKATDFSFQQELSSARLNITDPAHQQLPDQSDVRAYEVSTKVKADGNNVDLERELTQLTKNGLQYVTMVQYLGQKFRMIRNSINEGGKV